MPLLVNKILLSLEYLTATIPFVHILNIVKAIQSQETWSDFNTATQLAFPQQEVPWLEGHKARLEELFSVAQTFRDHEKNSNDPADSEKLQKGLSEYVKKGKQPDHLTSLLPPLQNPPQRPNYPESWQLFERTTLITNNVFSNRLSCIDDIRQTQQAQKRSLLSFYTEVLHSASCLSAIQKEEFALEFPDIFRWIKFQAKVLTVEQREKLHQLVVDDEMEDSFLFHHQYLYSLLTDEQKKRYAEEPAYKNIELWLRFEIAAGVNEEQKKNICRYFKNLEAGKWGQQYVIFQIHKHVLTSDQKKILANFYPTYDFIGYSCVPLVPNLERSDRRQSSSSSTNHHVQPSNHIEVPMPSESFNKFNCNNFANRTAHEADIDKRIIDAVLELDWQTTSHNTAFFQRVDEDGYLCHVIFIKSDPALEPAKNLEIAREIVNRLQSHWGCVGEQNILLKESEEDTNNNAAFKKKNTFYNKTHNIGLTMRDSMPVGTVAIRAGTAGGVSDHAKELNIWLNKKNKRKMTSDDHPSTSSSSASPSSAPVSYLSRLSFLKPDVQKSASKLSELQAENARLDAEIAEREQRVAKEVEALENKKRKYEDAIRAEEEKRASKLAMLEKLKTLELHGSSKNTRTGNGRN